MAFSHCRPVWRRGVSALLLTVVLASFVLNGCVMGYRRYPRPLPSTAAERHAGRLTYHVEGTSLFGGHAALRRLIRDDAPFDRTENRATPPAEGVHVRARIALQSPSLAAAVFGYLSYSTLMILPVWSAKDGFVVVFDVYRDGDQLRSFEYEARRTTVGWLVLLPFVWVNLLTASEEQVFEAIGTRFFQDAAPFFGEDPA